MSLCSYTIFLPSYLQECEKLVKKLEKELKDEAEDEAEEEAEDKYERCNRRCFEPDESSGSGFRLFGGSK